MHHFKPMLVDAWQYGNAIISNTDQNLQGPEFAGFGCRKRKKKKPQKKPDTQFCVIMEQSVK